jgi:hypothetical protein
MGRALAALTPDPSKFTFDAELRAGLREETRLFLHEFARQNLPLTSLLDAPFTYANARVAAHYGLSGVSGAEPQRVDLTHFPQRGGLLTQGSFLAGTSSSTDTSVVNRGKWVLSKLLCSPPPPPPDGVVEVKVTELSADAPKKDQMAQHRADPACAGCHTAMDPIGFGLENYDAIGAWRTKDGVNDVDPTGFLPGAGAFDGPRELFSLLKEDPRLAACLTRTLSTYALGREPGSQDECSVRNAALRALGRGGGFRDLIVSLATDPSFRFQGQEE